MLENKIEQLHKQEEKIRQSINARNRKRKIKCASCSKSHEVCTLDAIQTHWYTPPSGCTGGDHWNIGEMQFVCPDTKIVNRIMFYNYDVPWEKRSHYAWDPEEQFRRQYGDLFKSVKKTYEKVDHYKTVNNEYVDDNRKKFGLVEKGAYKE